MKEIIIGIDLGTTNSEVAIVENGRVRVISDETKRRILPSVVGITEDGTLLVGEPARNQYILYPERTVRSIKRKMGSDEPVDLAGQKYTPQEISAIILKRLKTIAEADLGQPIKKAVITVPAYFSDAQRQATREAGEIAGLEVVRMINEPTAAALAYEAGHQGQRRILVYDLGGGTFDVSVVSMEDGVVEVLASHGNNFLGGDDFDDKVVSFITDHLKAHHGVDVRESRRVMARIRRIAESSKIALSDSPFIRIEEEYLTEKDGTPVHLSVELSRDEYETLITPFIDETLNAVHTALKGAGLTASAIDEVLLVGGATRTPLIYRRLKDILGKDPRGEVDPDLCVAMGASIQGGMIAGENVNAVLVDVTPYTFGTSAVGMLHGVFSPNCFVPIIHKNSTIPVTKTESFATLHDEQEKVDVQVYQGENPDATRNTLIGEFTIVGLSRVPAGNIVLVRLSLDSDGILHVTAVEKATGLEKSITIHGAVSRLEGAKLATARDRIHSLFGEQDDVINQVTPTDASSTTEINSHQVVIQARALVEKAERSIEGASDEDRDEIVNLIETIRDALAADRLDDLKDPVEELSDILYYLEN
ncbi:Chaperone protein DnaK [Gammaproteobacteria bacterium]